MKLMYISSGEMGLYDGAATRVIPSQRVEQFARTLRDLERQNAWKTEGEGARFMHKFNPYANAAENNRGVITGLATASKDILYAVDLGRTGGIYRKNPLSPEEEEGLVTSGVGFRAENLLARGDVLYAAVREGFGSHIARLDPETGDYDLLTEGDTLERHPFPSRDGRTLYFDMSGFARDAQQRPTGKGPSAIAALNTFSGEIEEVYAAADTDYLKYTEAPDGTRRMLVRPYQARQSKANPLGCLLAPFSAAAGFVRVFSTLNAALKGKKPPLQASGGEAAQPMDEKLFVDGIAIDPKQLAREQRNSDDPYPGLIPRDWHLVRIGDGGAMETLREGVLDYLPLEDGGYIYSNGAHVFHVDSSGASNHLFKARLATDFTLLAD